MSCTGADMHVKPIKDLQWHLDTIVGEPKLGRLSILLSFMQENAAKVLSLIRQRLGIALVSGVLACVAFIVPRVLYWRTWLTVGTTSVGILLAVLSLLLLIDAVLISGPLLAFHFTRFFLLDQQERILSALCVALERGSPVVLYLRSFQAEDLQARYANLDAEVEFAIGADSVIAAINDPSSDLTERMTPIAKIMVQANLWQGLVDCLIPRACLIIAVLGEPTEGLLFELDLLRKHGAKNRTIVVLADDGDEAADKSLSLQLLSEDFPCRARLGTPELGEALCLWHDSLPRPVAHSRRAREAPPKRIAHVHRLSSLLPRLFLYGIRDMFAPRDALARYQRGRLACAEFDPFNEIRQAVLEQELESYKSGAAFPPLRMIFTEDSGAPIDEGTRKWNDAHKLLRRMETASWVLEKRSTWMKLRSAIKRHSSRR